MMCVCIRACAQIIPHGLFHMQPPTEKVLGQDFHLTPSGAMRELKDCFYYVPLLSLLQAMLKHREIRDQVNLMHVATGYFHKV